MSPVVTRYAYTTGEERWVFFCPGCKCNHSYTTKRGVDEKGNEYPGPLWSFNDNVEKPTFRASLLYPDTTPRCHLFITNGVIEYCTDCGHDLAGKHVPMEPIL